MKITVFYMDLRTSGKNYEEFLVRAQAQKDVHYLRGRVSKLKRRPDGKIRVMGVDTLLGEKVEVDADLVVLASAVVARADASKTSQIVGVPTDKDDFFSEAHPKLKPVETPTAGIYLAGVCQGPKDIPESVSCASAAAAKAIGILSKDHLESQAMTANVADTSCASCFACVPVCPYSAIEKQETRGGQEVAHVKEEICQGCGACVSTCRSGALNLKGFNSELITTEIESLCQS